MRLIELTLDQMLADEIVRLVMARDGVSEAQLRQLISSVGDRLRIRRVGALAKAA